MTNPVAQQLVAELETSITTPEVASILANAPPPPPPSDLGGLGLTSAPISAGPAPDLRLVGQPPAAKFDAKGSVREAAIPMAMRKFGAIAKMFPMAQKARVRKLDEPSGEWTTIGEYSLSTIIANGGDVESFLIANVVPKAKAGRYQVSIMDAGREHLAGDMRLGIAEETTFGGGGDSVSSKLVDALERRISQASPPTDPIETYRRMQEQMKAMKGDGDNSTMFMMMEMMKTMKGDSEMNALKAELAALRTAAAAAPPPMPMPSAPTETALEKAIAALLPALVPVLVSKFTAPAPEPKDPLEMLKLAKDLFAPAVPAAPPKSELDAFRESVMLMKEIRGETKTESLADELSKLAQIKTLAQDIVGEPAGGGNGQTTFWDALAGLFGNDRFADGLGKLLGTEVNNRRQQQSLPPNAPAVKTQVAPQTPPAPVTPRVDFPSNMKALCTVMEEAPDDQARITSTANLLYRLRSMPQWTPFVDGLLGLAASNEKDKALKSLENWLLMLAREKHLTVDAARRIFRSFYDLWDAFVTVLRNQLGMPALAAVAPQPLAPPDQLTPNPELTPAASSVTPMPSLDPVAAKADPAVSVAPSTEASDEPTQSSTEPEGEDEEAGDDDGEDEEGDDEGDADDED